MREKKVANLTVVHRHFRRHSSHHARAYQMVAGSVLGA